MAKPKIRAADKAEWRELLIAAMNGDILEISARPGASSAKIDMIGNDSGRPLLRIAVPAAPEDGKANAMLIQLLSDLLNIPKNDVELVSGPKNRNKRFRISHIVK